MAKHIHDGVLFSGTGLTGSHAAILHTAAGRLLGLVISHAQTSTQTVLFYNAQAATAGTEIAAFRVDPNQSPFAVFFARDAAIAFGSALYITATNCDVLIWSVDYG
jgi:hypothetical protein